MMQNFSFLLFLIDFFIANVKYFLKRFKEKGSFFFESFFYRVYFI